MMANMQMQMPTAESAVGQKLNAVDVAVVPEVNVKVDDTATATKDNTQKTAPAPGVVKHIVTFIGNGVWFDAIGAGWHRNHTNPEIKSEREFTDDEYKKREDLHFMVGYGQMKETTVTL